MVWLPTEKTTCAKATLPRHAPSPQGRNNSPTILICRHTRYLFQPDDEAHLCLANKRKSGHKASCIDFLVFLTSLQMKTKCHPNKAA
jgi:hypothetical protein